LFETLPEDLEGRGIVLGPHGDLLDFEWYKSEENEKWVLSTSVAIIQAFEDDSGVALSIDPHSIFCLARAVEYIPRMMEAPVLVDLCLVAKAVLEAKGSPVSMVFAVEMLLAQGRYVDLLLFFENKMKEGVFDRTFAPDLLELVESLESWRRHCWAMSGRDPDGMEGEGWRIRGNLSQRNMMRFCRGGLMQIERGLRIMSYEDIEDSMRYMVDGISTVGLSYAHSHEMGQMSDSKYTDSMSFNAYSFLMVNNLAGGGVPAEKILEMAAGSCMDDYLERSGVEKDPLLHYCTLFGHVMRLRSLSSSRDGVAWENAVTKAKEAIENCAQHRGWRTYESVITSLIETGRLGDMEEYASVLSRSD